LKTDRRVYKYIEFELYHYSEYKKNIENMRESILESSPEPPDGMPKGNNLGNPTESKALKLITVPSMLKMEQIINVVEKVLQNSTEIHRQIFKMKYVKCRRDIYKMCDELHVSYETFNRRKNELISHVAEELGI
jgi:RinA family phage transcriptional activator